jgi:type III secretion protein V
MVSAMRSILPDGPAQFGPIRFTVSDGALLAGLVAILAMLVLPLPPWLIDGLVGLNMAIGLVLLLAALHIDSPLELSAFPGVLLVSTLFRLALSIATTRQIMLHGHAGHVIDAFGHMVAGGQLLVGLVVFSIITVVQFIVVAKGAERVAEVAARFVLDALPGKQMAIDADLRSGLIDKDEARRRRRDLERESKLHGSLDGAMKFVKGDTVASLIIIAINGLGGLGIGMLQQGMSLSAAVAKYSILSIGEGMVAQLPALLSAMAAGLIVTRTGDNEGDRHLADTMARQFGARPRVPLLAAGLCAWLACLPGFPAAVFLPLASGLALAGVWRTAPLRSAWLAWMAPMRRRLGRPALRPAVPGFTAAPVPRTVPPLALQLAPALLAAQAEPQAVRALEAVLDRLCFELGLALPPIALRPLTATEGQHSAEPIWQLQAWGTPIASGHLDASGAATGVAEAVRQALRRHAGLFMGTQETSMLLNRAAQEAPELVKEVLRVLPVQRVAEILRRLLEESVCIHPLRDILEALGDAAQREKDVHAVTELTRMALRRQISHRAAPQGRLRAVLLLPELEDALRQSLHGASGSQQAALDPGLARGILDALAQAVQGTPGAAVITPVDLRRAVRKLIEPECFDTPVLSFHELVPTLQWDVVARLGMPASPSLPRTALP